MSEKQNHDTADRPVRVMLADDHHITLWGLEQLLKSASPAMEIAGKATSADELMSHPALPNTDVVLLDLGLSQRNSLDCLRRLIQHSRVQVVVLTGSTDPGSHRDAVRTGARGVVLKSQPAQHIIQAIQTVHAGSVWLDPQLVADALKVATQTLIVDPDATANAVIQRRIASLTPKERDVVKALVRHQGAKALVVAESLTMSEHTFRNHLTVIYSKLGIHGKLNLYVFAIQHGMATEPSLAKDAGMSQG